jgi:hypothetical protein
VLDTIQQVSRPHELFRQHGQRHRDDQPSRSWQRQQHDSSKEQSEAADDDGEALHRIDVPSEGDAAPIGLVFTLTLSSAGMDNTNLVQSAFSRIACSRLGMDEMEALRKNVAMELDHE